MDWRRRRAAAQRDAARDRDHRCRLRLTVATSCRRSRPIKTPPGTCSSSPGRRRSSSKTHTSRSRTPDPPTAPRPWAGVSKHFTRRTSGSSASGICPRTARRRNSKCAFRPLRRVQVAPRPPSARHAGSAGILTIQTRTGRTSSTSRRRRRRGHPPRTSPDPARGARRVARARGLAGAQHHPARSRAPGRVQHRVVPLRRFGPALAHRRARHALRAAARSLRPAARAPERLPAVRVPQTLRRWRGNARDVRRFLADDEAWSGGRSYRWRGR